MTGTTEVTAAPGAQDLTITRTFDAPRERVFRCWADPRLLERWLGPRSLTTAVETWELHHGGRWRFVSRDTEGAEYWFRGVFHGDPSAAAGIVWTFEFEGMPGVVPVLEHMTFAEADGRTTMTTHSVFQSVEDRDGMIASGMETGVDEGYAKLDELLATERAEV